MERPKLLMIEDESDIKALYKSILNRHFDFELVEANSIKAAQEILKECVPDFVLLDLNLQDGNGFDFIPDLKKNNPAVKILVVSAFNHCNEKKKAIDLGTYGLLAKPFESEALVEQINMMRNSK